MEGWRAELSAENAVVGALVIDSQCYDTVAGMVSAEDFGAEATRQVFEAAVKLHDAGRTIDAVTLANELGGDYGEYIMGLMDLTPTARNVAEYCRLMLEGSRRRAALRLSDELREGALAGEPPEALAERAREAIERLRPAEELLDGAAEAKAWYDHYARLKEDPERAYCRTGYAAIDRMLGGGLYAGGVYILAGRPGMGKTTQGIAIAERVAKSGRRVMLVSLEMGRDQIISKRLAMESGVPYSQIMAADLSAGEEAQVFNALADISERPFITVDDAVTVSAIERYARRAADLRLLVIDYLGLVQTDREYAKRNDEVARISADIKVLARRLDIPILVLAQINRDNTKRADKRPTMADLRDSGATEQDASAVILLHRDGYYARSEERPQVEPIEFIIDKNRHGMTGTVELLWHGASGRIEEDKLPI